MNFHSPRMLGRSQSNMSNRNVFFLAQNSFHIVDINFPVSPLLMEIFYVFLHFYILCAPINDFPSFCKSGWGKFINTQICIKKTISKILISLYNWTAGRLYIFVFR